MHTGNSYSNLMVLTVMAFVSFTVLVRPARGLAAEGTLTGGTIKAHVEDRAAPSFPNETARVRVRADYTTPTASAECGMITGPTWAWSIRSVERQNPTTMAWEASTYRPNLGYKHRQRATVWARFPSGGVWRVTLDVKAVWASEACGSCEATDSLVVDFPDVSDGSFVGVVAFTDEFDGRSRTSAGLKETGTLSVRFAPGTVLADVAPLTWKLRSGSDFIDDWEDTGDGTASFEASYNTGQAVFELKSGKTGGVATVTLDVVAPSGVQHTFVQFDPANGVNAGKINFHIYDKVHLLPKNVSFANITCGEGEDPEADTKGELQRAAVARLGIKCPHPLGGPYKITIPTSSTEGSCWESLDRVGPGTIEENGEAGYFIWEIPQQWIGAFMTRNDFTVLTQRHDFDGKRTIRLQKGGRASAHSGWLRQSGWTCARL